MLLATNVSMLAEPCFSCFQALMKNVRPKTNTTGVESAHVTQPAQGRSMNPMPMMAMGMASRMAAMVRRFNE